MAAETAHMTEPIRIGIIGCGNILPQYIKGTRQFPIIDLVAVADLLPERAQAAASEWQIAHAYTVDELLADPDIQIVINLTIPQAHVETSQRILAAGKHVYSEKPLGITFAEGQQLSESAKAKGLLIGCAPDTFLGGGLQTCRHLLDQGTIGRPVAVDAHMFSHGPEPWHPNPIIFYQKGAGPLFDMGPYYLTAMVALLGGISEVSGLARASFAERTITGKARYGETFPVDVETHISGSLAFADGVIGTLITTFDVYSDRHSYFEIFGETGTLRVPDPNSFTGPVEVWHPMERTWESILLTHSETVGRGIGVADLASAILHKRPARASGDQALHVLDVMESLLTSAHEKRTVALRTSVTRPAPLPIDLLPGVID